MMSLTGKVALVTGARRGLGLMIAEHLLARDATVIGLARGDTAIDHDRYHHYAVDITDAAAVQALFRAVGRDFGGLDILVNNAGVLTAQHAMILPPAAAKAMIDTNIFGTFMVSREASRLMRRRPGARMVNIGSMAASLQPAGDSIYAATKAAVAVMANVLAKELGPMGITCNTLAVTAILSDMLDQLPRDKIDAIIAGLPVPRLATGDDVMNALDFFLSPRSSYITAQTLWLGGIHQ
jgi:3-oxoacyl-[acyl-carrier protein] reductase